jgi:hypothetical protein
MYLLVVVVMHYFFSNLFHLKHFIADFPLQNEYMLGKFKADWGFVKPLMAHVAVHGVMTFLILLIFAPWLSLGMILGLSLMDMVIHFFMDRIKAGPKYLGGYQSMTKQDFIDHQKALASFEGAKKDYANDKSMIHQMDLGIMKHEEAFAEKKQSNKYFWWSLGIDQMMHGLTHELIVFITILMFIIGIQQ